MTKMRVKVKGKETAGFVADVKMGVGARLKEKRQQGGFAGPKVAGMAGVGQKVAEMKAGGMAVRAGRGREAVRRAKAIAEIHRILGVLADEKAARPVAARSKR